MTVTVMMTLPRNRESIEEVYLLQWMFKNDIHKWIIAKEIGNDGYKHWQIRMQTRHTFEELKKEFPKAHIEEASDDYNYERKEGSFITSNDTPEILGCRFGTYRENQRRILDNLRTQSNREIDIIVDRKGGSGKSHLARMLYENGKAFFVPPTCNTAQTIIQFVTSGYRNEGIIIIDIPRSTRWTTQLYVGIECIKDGLVYDTRYHTTVRNIFGVRILVFCNTKPNLSKLSSDRWRLFDANGVPLKDGPTL